VVGVLFLERWRHFTHAYTVAAVVNPDTLTATFVPAALSGFFTDPPGLSLSIDGRTTGPPTISLGVLEKSPTVRPRPADRRPGPHLELSANGSNGGPATQTG